MEAAILIPKWLVDEHAITLATWGLVFVTLLLVLATVILWWDSFTKGKEQRERWRREDEVSAELRKPKFRFGLSHAEGERLTSQLGLAQMNTSAELWVANFGSLGLYVNTFYVKHRDLGVHSTQVNRLVGPASEMRFIIPDSDWQKGPGTRGSSDGNYVYGDHEIWLEMSDASGDFESPKILYFLSYSSHRFDSIRRGNHEQRQPVCPRCGKYFNLVLPPTGVISEADVYWTGVLEDFSNSCPNHSSARLVEIGK
jgi:hypothetical protein